MLDNFEERLLRSTCSFWRPLRIIPAPPIASASADFEIGAAAAVHPDNCYG